MHLARVTQSVQLKESVWHAVETARRWPVGVEPLQTRSYCPALAMSVRAHSSICHTHLRLHLQLEQGQKDEAGSRQEEDPQRAEGVRH